VNESSKNAYQDKLAERWHTVKPLTIRTAKLVKTQSEHFD